MKNAVLVGFMGTGKTFVGKEVAYRLKYEHIDIDELIEKAEGMKVADIFKKYGEPYFREREREAVEKLKDRENLVISAGGGIVLDQGNVDNLKKKGILICLTATPEVVFERLKYMTDRPILNVDDPKEKIRILMKFREPFYKKADYEIDTSNLPVEGVVEKVEEVYTKAVEE